MTAYRFNLSLSNIIVNKGGVFLHINYISIWTESKSKFRLMCKEAKLNNQDIFGCPLWIALMDTYMDTKLCSILNRLSKTRIRFPPPPPFTIFNRTSLLLILYNNIKSFCYCLESINFIWFHPNSRVFRGRANWSVFDGL